MAKGDPEPPNVYYLHRYRVIDVPEGCTDLKEGDYVNLNVTHPAPSTAVLNNGGACDGINVVLDDPPPDRT